MGCDICGNVGSVDPVRDYLRTAEIHDICAKCDNEVRHRVITMLDPLSTKAILAQMHQEFKKKGEKHSFLRDLRKDLGLYRRGDLMRALAQVTAERDELRAQLTKEEPSHE